MFLRTSMISDTSHAFRISFCGRRTRRVYILCQFSSTIQSVHVRTLYTETVKKISLSKDIRTHFVLFRVIIQRQVEYDEPPVNKGGSLSRTTAMWIRYVAAGIFFRCYNIYLYIFMYGNLSSVPILISLPSLCQVWSLHYFSFSH